jgi:hypothetical protein
LASQATKVERRSKKKTETPLFAGISEFLVLGYLDSLFVD